MLMRNESRKRLSFCYAFQSLVSLTSVSVARATTTIPNPPTPKTRTPTPNPIRITFIFPLSVLDMRLIVDFYPTGVFPEDCSCFCTEN